LALHPSLVEVLAWFRRQPVSRAPIPHGLRTPAKRQPASFLITLARLRRKGFMDWNLLVLEMM